MVYPGAMATKPKATKNTKAIAAAATKKAEGLLRLIDRRKARILEDFYDIGIALRELLEKKLFLALGFRTFEELLDKRGVMGRTQAFKLIAVTRELPRERALDLGAERAYAMVTVAAATPEKDTAASILNTGVAVGGHVEDVSKMSKRELVAVAKKVRPKKRAGEAEAAARAGARKAQATLRARKIAATVTVDHAKGEWFAVIRLPVKNLSAVVRER